MSLRELALSFGATARLGHSRAPPTAIMAAEKVCGACNGVILGSTQHACGECEKDVHSWALCEHVVTPVFGAGTEWGQGALTLKLHV